MAIGSSKLYGMGRSDPSRGMMEELTTDRAKAESVAKYEQTKRMAAEKASSARIKANMSTEKFKLDTPPAVSNALKKATGSQ